MGLILFFIPAMLCYLSRDAYPRVSSLCGALTALEILTILAIAIFSP